ncbi:PAS domain-containing protein [Parvibaculum sp.]|uniref:PAS domain-containing protein n=1 Tax=Parvibaculum sp. TaxID=2024848 RepID=UPI002BCC0811|nr:PAS domain-containing protein [Parvibaculum sp.]HUD50988.1 PAS domain-containing protein [Parvibaculum sp.]
MKHKTTQVLFDYWNAARAGRPAPLRSEIEPGAIRRVLPHVFILERQSEQNYRFRLAGTGLCGIYGMEFRGHNFLAMWQDDCQESLEKAFLEVTNNGNVAIVEYTASTNDHREATFEMILLPLAQDNGAITRVLGAAVPIDDFTWIGERLFARQWIDRLQILDPERMPKRERAVESARRIVREKPPVVAATVTSLAHRRPPLRSERSYLRLIKTAGGEEHK